MRCRNHMNNKCFSQNISTTKKKKTEWCIRWQQRWKLTTSKWAQDNTTTIQPVDFTHRFFSVYFHWEFKLSFLRQPIAITVAIKPKRCCSATKQFPTPFRQGGVYRRNNSESWHKRQLSRCSTGPFALQPGLQRHSRLKMTRQKQTLVQDGIWNYD